MNETQHATQSTNLPSALFRSIFRLLVHVFLSSFRPRLYIVDDEPDFLTLDENGYTVVASKREQIISLNGKTVAVFKNVEAIQIRHFVRGAGNGRREWWTLSLKLTRRPVLYLGKSSRFYGGVHRSGAFEHINRTTCGHTLTRMIRSPNFCSSEPLRRPLNSKLRGR